MWQDRATVKRRPQTCQGKRPPLYPAA